MTWISLLLACGLGDGTVGVKPGETDIVADTTPDAADTDAPDETLPVFPDVCMPQIAVEPHALEGREIVATVSCETGADPLAVGLTWIAPGFTVDGLTARWTPGLADAGLHDVLVSVPHGSGLPETGVATISVADDWQHPENVRVDPATYTEEWGIPVLSLLPDADIGFEDVPMTAWWDGVAYTGDIHIRGAASASYPKNNYTLEFEPTQLKIVDSSDKDHLVLISNFDDNSHMRQKLVFDSWAEMATFAGEDRLTPRSFFVVVYIEGTYSGLYVAVDHVDDEFISEMGLDQTGNLYKSVSHDANFYLKDSLSAGWEKKEGADLGDFSDLDALTAWAGSVSDAQFAAEVGSWLPVDEFADWFLLVHHTASDDSAGKNAYLYNQPTAGTWWRYAPWDFNHSYGQAWTTARVAPDSYNLFQWNNAIFKHIQQEPALATQMWDRYRALREPGQALAVDRQLAQIDAMAALIDDSARRDWSRWEADYRSYWGWRNDILDYDGEKAYLEQWVIDRDVFLQVADP